MELSSPFPANVIKWRVGPTNQDKTKGRALAYIDARDVMRRLDAVHPLGWQDNYQVVDGCLVCSIGINVPGLNFSSGWLWRSDGVPIRSTEGMNEAQEEMSVKGAFSDAFKRAAVKWGIGRYLYDLPDFWVEIEQWGRSYKLKTVPTIPNQFLPKEDE